MERLNQYPTQIVGPFKSAEKANDEAAMHKSLLDMGESFLTYLVGIMFGEYKRSGEINEDLETEFYKFSSRKPSFGVFLAFLRDHLSKDLSNTILSDKFEKSKTYEAASEFIFEFDLLKQIINDGSDDGFSDKVESLRKGRSIGKKGLIEFFNTFIMIRNIFAHPDEKAGPKDNKRKWPLGEEYYAFINPYMLAALTELVEDFDILSSYKPVIARMLDDKNKKGTFVLEQGRKESEIDMDLSTDDLRFMNTDLRYLLDPEDKLFVKLYYHAIPQLNPEVAKKIIDREKAKAMEPHLKEMIHGKLADDGKIDDMEYLVLRDTAKTSSISEERLFQLIDAVKNQLQIKDSVGTPENKGDIFIEAKDDSITISFNPWWLHYLSTYGKMDKKVVKDERSRVDKMKKSITKLKAEKKSLPINKRIASAKNALKEKRAKKAIQMKKMQERLKKKREMRAKATKSERKASLLEEIKSLQEDINAKRDNFDLQINEIIEKIEEIELEKVDKSSSIDHKISEQTHTLEQYEASTQWGRHKLLWEELNQYVDSIIDENLNTGSSATDGDESTDLKWVNSPNAWQIGNLTSLYWAKIHPKQAPLGNTYNVGYAIGKRFKWVPKNIHPTMTETLKKPCSVIWTTQDDQNAERIDIDGQLGLKKAALNVDLLQDYEKELIELGANVRCTLKGEVYDLNQWDNETYFMPLKVFLEEQDKYSLQSIFSRFWTLDAFFNRGKVNLEALNLYKKESVTMIQIFSNTVTKLNDYALEIGINQETIQERYDRFHRLKEIMFLEYEKLYPKGTPFLPTKEETKSWRIFAREELGVKSDYIYNMIIDKYRWSSKGK